MSRAVGDLPAFQASPASLVPAFDVPRRSGSQSPTPPLVTDPVRLRGRQQSCVYGVGLAAPMPK